MMSRLRRYQMTPWKKDRILLYLLLLFISGNCQVIEQAPKSKSEFAESAMNASLKQDMLDAHNKFRSMVQPEAANMEYQVWSDDLASLAQMWVNKCIWGHGYIQFGSEFPKDPSVATRDEHVGQNMAREYGKLVSPPARVEKWYNEVKFYKYNKFDIPMGADQCVPGKICGHYTQLAWATSKNVGCGYKWCNKNFDSGYHPPENPGETLVGCDYAPGGNIIGEYPYKLGTPCSKCASGFGWCYKKLCRDCADHSLECGKSLTKDMCTVDVEKMKKFCPKLCDLCECPLQCKKGELDKAKCQCKCPSGYRPPDCSEKCEDVSKYRCKDYLNKGRKCEQTFMQEKCPATCGICEDGSSVPTASTTSKPTPAGPGGKGPTTAPAPAPLPTPAPPQPPQPPPGPPSPAPAPSPSPPAPSPSTPPQPPTNTPTPSTRPPTPEPNPLPGSNPVEPSCEDMNSQCPLWADQLECETNRNWMLKNCKTSCNQCKECEDLLPTCPEMALIGYCQKMPENMLTKCRRSCGLCRVYDKEKWCPAWAAQGDCHHDNHWAWMMNNCPRSCDLPLSKHQFCAAMPDGYYPTHVSCKGYIQCSYGWTKYQACPTGKWFDAESKTCRMSEHVYCDEAQPIVRRR